MKPKVLVACEESQVVCTAMRKVGCEAYSCDIIEPSGGHPEWHILGDALQAIRGGTITTMDGVEHDINKWDLLIAHPPCTYLSNVATRSFSLRMSKPEDVVDRWNKRAKAAVFFMRFALADVDRIAVENPVGFMTNAFRKPDQYIQPWWFADTEDSENYAAKKTGLWLKNLEPLKPTTKIKTFEKDYGTLPSGKKRTWEDTVSRDAKIRSRTFPGIAEAMAEQWGRPLVEEVDKEVQE